MRKFIVASILAFSLLSVSVGIAGASGGPNFAIQTNPCVRDLYSTLASLGSHPRRSDVDAAVADYMDCRGGATSFGSPFQFDFPVTRPFNFGFFPGQFSDFGGGNNFFLVGQRCVLDTSFFNNTESFGTWEFVSGNLECVPH